MTSGIKGLILASILFWSCCSFAAGDFAGNGGHLVACDTGGSIRYQLLDYYEADRRGDLIDLGPDDLPVYDKVQLAIERLVKLDPQRHRFFLKLLDSFFDNLILRPELPNTNDQGPVELASNCHLVQFAAQFQPRFPGDIIFTVNKAYWESKDISNDDKAGLIIHEFVYLQGILEGHGNSLASRSFAAFLSGKRPETLGTERYREMLLSRGFTLDHTIAVFGDRYDVKIANPLLYEGNIYFSRTHNNVADLMEHTQHTEHPFSDPRSIHNQACTSMTASQSHLYCLTLGPESQIISVEMTNFDVKVLEPSARYVSEKLLFAEQALFWVEQKNGSVLRRLDLNSQQIFSTPLNEVAISELLGIDATHYYFATDTSIFKQSRTDAKREILHHHPIEKAEMVGDFLYFVTKEDSGTSSLMRMNLTSLFTERLIENVDVLDYKVDDNEIFYLERHRLSVRQKIFLKKLDIPSGKVRAISAVFYTGAESVNGIPRYVLVDEDYIYWFSDRRLKRLIRD